MPFIPHTDKDKEDMLLKLGVSKIDELFAEIPPSLFCGELENIPEGISEMAMLKEARQLANSTQNGLCFMGAGSYDHHIPAVVWDIASRGEFLTSYTPYQAEASQGSLQLLYEFQTMIAELTAMDVANASLYDGATALAEAVLMAVRLNKTSRSKQILVAGTVHPYYREALETIVRNQHIEIITLPFDSKIGIVTLAVLESYQHEDITALVIAQPNFFGCLEAVDELTDWARNRQTISIACVNPLTLAVLKPPGKWGKAGVDIACGEGQPLGVPMASGGPYFGFFSTRKEHIRQMPGRLVGRTTDIKGNLGYCLTLQTREQHIKRSKATSNICTNQGLLVTAATIHMSLLGAKGLSQVAQQCFQNTHDLVELLTQNSGVELVFSAPYFHEVLLKFNYPIQELLEKLNRVGILGGYPVEQHYSPFENSLLVCATETRSPEDIAYYAASLKQIITEQGN